MAVPNRSTRFVKRYTVPELHLRSSAWPLAMTSAGRPRAIEID